MIRYGSTREDEDGVMTSCCIRVLYKVARCCLPIPSLRHADDMPSVSVSWLHRTRPIRWTILSISKYPGPATPEPRVGRSISPSLVLSVSVGASRSFTHLQLYDSLTSVRSI